MFKRLSAETWVLLIALTLSGAGSFFRVLLRSQQSDVAIIAAAVRETFTPGDALLFQPAYNAHVYSQLGDLSPQSSAELFPEELPPRLHFLSLKGISLESSPDFESLGYSLSSSHTFAGGEWSVWEKEGSPPATLDLWRDIKQLRVSIHSQKQGGKLLSQCDYKVGVGFSCPKRPQWNRVSRELFDSEAGPRRCLWMHPPNKDEVLRISLPPLAPTPLHLSGGMMFSQHAAQSGRVPVQVELLSGPPENPQIHWAEQHGRSPHWRPISMDIETGENLFFEIHSENSGAAHFCLNAQFHPLDQKPTPEAGHE